MHFSKLLLLLPALAAAAPLLQGAAQPPILVARAVDEDLAKSVPSWES